MDYRVRKVINLLRDGFRQKLSVDQLARDVELSASRFTHLFKAETGRTPTQYLHQLRMEQGKLLLETTALTIEQIVLHLGLKDRSHFEREFKKTYGLTPTQHRVAARQASVLEAARIAIN